MRARREAGVWARRGVLAVVLVGAVVIPSRAVSQQARHCAGPRCTAGGSVLWTRGLTGSWLAEAGVSGTVPATGAAYAASGGGLAVAGAGLTVTGFRLDTGAQLWQTTLTGMPAGSAITGVRAFTGVVAVGVQPPPGQQPERYEVILSAVTGDERRVYPAAAYGGTIAASAAAAVVVGDTAITDYDNATGRALWSRATGPASSTWRISGQYAYLAQGASSAGVAAVRQVSLRTGAERVLRPPQALFPGSLAVVLDDVMLFAGAGDVYAYGTQTGGLLWQRRASVLELTDSAAGVAYLASGKALVGVDVHTGGTISSTGLSVAGSLFWVAGGQALGLDENALGDAYGYDLARHQVQWTSAALPWPHFFTDLSGLGGSAAPGSDTVLLATCARTGKRAAGAAGPECLRPQLAAVRLTSQQP